MMRTTSHILFVVAVIALFNACGSYVPVAAGDNFAYLYGKGAAAIRLEARVYRPSTNEAVIYFKLRTSDLLYKGTGGGAPYHARVVMSYEAYGINDPKRLLDSASTYIKDQSMATTQDKALIGSMPLKATSGSPFLLRITAHDLNRDAESTMLLRVIPEPMGNAQTYLPLGLDNLPLFSDRLPPGSLVKVRAESHTGTLLHAAHYLPTTKLPAPVFAESPQATIHLLPDSTFNVMVQPDGTFSFTVPAEGFYHFRADTATMAGFTLFAAKEGYPAILDAQDMVAPLRYITSTKEWESLSTATDPRKEVERFWTDAAGNRDRAREAIAAYYGRVESANRHFSGFSEGWKTDRGLVHIIFGTPSSIRLDDRGETWTYGDETNLMSLVFRFIRRDNPFSDNDLVLQRDPQLKSAWYRNVESWRNGRILQN